ncbi:unnamed protein product [Didymodactylos carnosus]|uniref:FAD dependent oxidoreductase domain-containing protein n=1 Tax=Didymodactylos carnosus TaxID=1234261 RepID=A0A8S2GD99_9BILA|nr:unnamed protein product [Didymodactylos carnosus]CAF3496248.1 unnamed protein product [Didymodactylos carnosus]
MQWIFTVLKFFPVIAIIILSFMEFDSKFINDGLNLVDGGRAPNKGLISVSPYLGIFASVPAIFYSFDGFYSVTSLKRNLKSERSLGPLIAIGLSIVVGVYLLISTGLFVSSSDGTINNLKINPYLRKAITAVIAIAIIGVLNGELVATFILILLGNGVVYNVIGKKTKGSGGGIISIGFGWGFAVLIGSIAGTAIGGSGAKPSTGVSKKPAIKSLPQKIQRKANFMAPISVGPKTYDAIIIGAGIIGSSIAYELVKNGLKVLVLEKNPHVASETTSGNSSIIHGGFDAKTGKLKAKLNVEVIGFSKNDTPALEDLYARGIANGVPKNFLKIINRSELLAMEPNINPRAHIENEAVTSIKFSQRIFLVGTNKNKEYRAKLVINAAGHYADSIAALAGYPDFKQTARRGQYIVLARDHAAGMTKNVCFLLPTKFGKGVLVTEMLDGNVLIGPTAEDGVAKTDARTINKKMNKKIIKNASLLFPKLPFDKQVSIFAGSRPIDQMTSDFVIAPAKQNAQFINAAGMQSPGLSAAPAVALRVLELVREAGVQTTKNSDFRPHFRNRIY